MTKVDGSPGMGVGGFFRNISSLLFFALAISANAETSLSNESNPVPQTLLDRTVNSLSIRYPGSKIEIQYAKWISSPDSAVMSWPISPRSVQEVKPGEVIFEVMQGETGKTYQFIVQYAAWFETYIAKKRIRPRDKIDRSSFEIGKIDVSKGQAREYRGLIFPSTYPLEGLEATQTVLEGNFALLSGVKKIPAIKSGEPLKIKIISGGVEIQTSGTAEEPAYVGDVVRVSAMKTKRMLTGKLKEDGWVEVER